MSAASKTQVGWVGLALATTCTSALAHGEQIMFFAGGALGLGVGALFGLVAGLRAEGQFPTLGHALLIFLVVGMFAASIAAGSIEGAPLFLVFAGISGAVPFIAGYHALRAVLGLCRTAYLRRKGRPHAGA
jgi:hypothetical protein